MQPTSPPSAPGATPATPGAGQSFREQALARLRAESAPSPAPVAPVPRRQPPVQPRAEAQQAGNSGQDPQPDHPDAEAGAEDPAQQQQQDPESADGGKQPDLEGEEPEYGEDVQTLHAELKARDAEIERLSRREQELTRDYTRKTMQVAEYRRELEGQAETVRNTARYIASKIDAPLRQFEAVDWANLQAQDPAKYQTTRQQYEQTLRARQQFMSELAQVEQMQEQQIEAARQREAAIGVDILTSRIPGWSADMYAELRQFAVEEYGYKAEDLDRNVDYRLMLALRDAQLSRKAAKSVKVNQRQPAKPAPPTGQARQAFRSDTGQFQSAKQNMMNSPGNRVANRNYFRAKLAAERKRNGG
jgi:hypothetical protein